MKLGRVSFFGRYYGNPRLRFVSMRECMRWRDGLISGDNCTQPDVSKYVRSVSNGFLQAFVACLVILKLPQMCPRCLKGTLVVPSVGYPVPRRVRREVREGCPANSLFQRRFRCRRRVKNTPKILENLVEKLRISSTNGTIIQKVLAFLDFENIYYSFEQLWCPGGNYHGKSAQ